MQVPASAWWDQTCGWGPGRRVGRAGTHSSLSSGTTASLMAKPCRRAGRGKAAADGGQAVGSRYSAAAVGRWQQQRAGRGSSSSGGQHGAGSGGVSVSGKGPACLGGGVDLCRGGRAAGLEARLQRKGAWVRRKGIRWRAWLVGADAPTPAPAATAGRLIDEQGGSPAAPPRRPASAPGEWGASCWRGQAWARPASGRTGRHAAQRVLSVRGSSEH